MAASADARHVQRRRQASQTGAGPRAFDVGALRARTVQAIAAAQMIATLAAAPAGLSSPRLLRGHLQRPQWVNRSSTRTLDRKAPQRAHFG